MKLIARGENLSRVYHDVIYKLSHKLLRMTKKKLLNKLNFSKDKKYRKLLSSRDKNEFQEARLLSCIVNVKTSVWQGRSILYRYFTTYHSHSKRIYDDCCNDNFMLVCWLLVALEKQFFFVSLGDESYFETTFD